MRLTIKSVRAQDFGSFRCISTNSLGETESKIKVYSDSNRNSNSSSSSSSSPMRLISSTTADVKPQG
ncbi:hypothetical protein M0804_015414 [Polistes exclamans]|nr:hypothetical protein M0804_015414 [Polistes exclamans]